MRKIPRVEQADATEHKGKYHKLLKRRKARLERRKAKENPDCIPSYGKYCGYET